MPNLTGITPSRETRATSTRGGRAPRAQSRNPTGVNFIEQLKQWEKHEMEINPPKPAKTEPPFYSKGRIQPRRLLSRPAERVVGGEVLWEPVDRAAALLIAKAPWHAHPPAPAEPATEVKPPQKPKPKSKKKMSGTISEHIPPTESHYTVADTMLRLADGNGGAK